MAFVFEGPQALNQHIKKKMKKATTITKRVSGALQI
jgi:hypothetical protein